MNFQKKNKVSKEFPKKNAGAIPKKFRNQLPKDLGKKWQKSFQKTYRRNNKEIVKGSSKVINWEFINNFQNYCRTNFQKNCCKKKWNFRWSCLEVAEVISKLFVERMLKKIAEGTSKAVIK